MKNKLFESIYRKTHLKESGGYYGKNYYDSPMDIVKDYKKGWIGSGTAYDIAEKFDWNLDSYPPWIQLIDEEDDDFN